MHQEIVMAGTGGQGVMLIGKLLAQAAMMENKNVVWLPSYGPEARGGSANCSVIVSTDEIGSPLTIEPDTLIALNQESLDRFVNSVQHEGIIVVNTTLANRPEAREDCKIVEVAASKIANELGDLRVTNMVILGAYVQASKAVELDSIKAALAKIFPASRHNLLPLNEKAIDLGAASVK
jgi:2-oxoglutarate ferredoxin oxidoreductase subunit gamma